MKIIFVGDIVGRPGRTAFRRWLPGLAEEFGADLVIANAENAAAGFGVTANVVKELLEAGAQVLTSGNHIWRNKEVSSVLGVEPRLLRPANYPQVTPGPGCGVFEAPGGRRVGVLNLCGRTFMDPLDCPFQVAERELPSLLEQTSLVVVDIHAEATSEKLAMGWHLDGRVSAVIGTHTHVQTADEQILPKGTGYLTDVGMTGPKESILGIKGELIMQRFLTRMPIKFEIPGGPAVLSAVALEVDDASGRCLSIERIQRTGPTEDPAE